MKSPIQRRLRGRARGVTLLEVIAYLGVAGLIIAGSVAMLTKAFGSSDISTAQQQIEGIHTSVKKLFGAASTYGTTIMNPDLISAQAFPSTLRLVPGTGGALTVTNRWSGGVTVTGAGSAFTLGYTGVPDDACIEIITSLPNNHWAKASVNGTDVADIKASPAVLFPVSLTTAAANCTKGAAGNAFILTSVN